MLSRKLLFNITHNNHHSTYRYDDAGNRTVKLSGNGNAVFVCASDSSNGFTQTNRFTAYPNPYMVYNGSRYYKHIYIGSDRIVSKVSANNPDYDPRQEDCAGNSITGYNVKLQSQQQALSDSIASIYAKFEVPYYPNNNDDYGYNWNDGLRRSVATSDSYGELAYFYHSDHLGSTSYVTDANGEVTQHVEYVPFGEVFIEERNNTWNTPYLFNAKELDEETGLYYYGARYYDPRISLWLSTDPMELKYPNVSTYAYCLNNPIKHFDYEGGEPIGAIVEGVVSFGVSAGVDFVSNWLIGGQDVKTALCNVSWGSAIFDGISTAGLSLFINGTGSAKTLAKIAKSKSGKITYDIVQNLISNITENFEIGKYESFSDIEFKTEFLWATVEALLYNGFNSRAEELMESFRDSNKKLYNKYQKLRMNQDAGKSEIRIARDENQVSIATKRSISSGVKYVTEDINANATTKSTVKTLRAYDEENKNKK